MISNISGLVRKAVRPDRLQATGIKLSRWGFLIWGWATIDNFTSAANLNAIMYSVSAVGIAAVGMAFITLSGHLFYALDGRDGRRLDNFVRVGLFISA